MRNLIYELVFHLQSYQHNESAELQAITLTPSERNNTTRKPSVLDLLSTCRQIHYEAETIFYELNNLRYSTKIWHACDPFLRTLGPRRLKAINALTIVSQTENQALAEVACNIKLATDLKTLHIELPARPWLNDDLATAWARDVRFALKGTPVELVRILLPDTRIVKTLGSGGSNNNSYVFITERAMLKRARELSRLVEDIINAV